MLILSLFACRDPEPRSFGEDFRFGSATAGFQMDAGCPTLPAEQCEDRASDWYQWVTDSEIADEPNTFISGDPMDAAPGHWELWEPDLDLAANELHSRAFRFSFEWSRLFPDGAAEQATTVEELAEYADPEALAWYHAYLDGIVSRGMVPIATVNHYTLPLWIHDGKACHFDPEGCEDRGWMDPERITPAITLYSAFLAREFGEDITWWLTLNEPMAVVVSGYTFQTQDRTNPPGISDMGKALDVAWAMVQAHASMSDAIHAEDADALVGVVVNTGSAYPDDPADPEDVEAAEHLDYVYNQLVLDAFLEGVFDENLDGTPDVEDPSIAGKTDWLGLNYYFAFKVQGFASPLPGFGDYAYMDFYPEELDPDPAFFGDAMDMTLERGLPVWITENGKADPTEEDVEGYMIPALEQVQSRVADGADLRGYLWWSLIDNYEWNHGMGMKFGLYEVDLDTKARTLRPIGAKFGEIAEANALPPLEAEE